jgi:hypothetical protein
MRLVTEVLSFLAQLLGILFKLAEWVRLSIKGLPLGMFT